MNSPQSNPRSATRFLALLPAVLHSEGQEYPCEAANLSRSGALLIGALPIPTSPHAKLTLKSPTGDLQVTLNGLLARVQPGTAGEDQAAVGLAIRFCGIPLAEHATLQALVSRVIEGGAPLGTLQKLPANASKSEIVEALERLPIPQRVALAIRAQLRERQWLVDDPNPQVINALVRNPQLGFREVQEILRLRSLSTTALETLARDTRWHDERLRVSIATHPNAPLPLAEQIALEMGPNALAKVIQASSLNDGLRQKLLRRQAQQKVRG